MIMNAGTRKRSPKWRRAVLITLALLVGVYLLALMGGEGDKRHEAVLSARSALQDALDDERCWAILPPGLFHSYSRELLSSLPRSPAIQHLTTELAEALDAHDAYTGGAKLTGPFDLELRLARGTLFNAQGEYEKTLALIKISDKRLASSKTRRILGFNPFGRGLQLQDEIDKVRGDAMRGQQPCRGSLKYFRRTLSLRASTNRDAYLEARFLMARRNFAEPLRLGFPGKHKSGEMEEVTTGLIAAYRLEAEQTDDMGASNALARALGCRALVYRKEERYGDALRDFNEAITILEDFLEKEERAEWRQDLALVSADRAITWIWQARPEPPEGIEDDEEAELMYRWSNLYLLKQSGVRDRAVRDWCRTIAMLSFLADDQGRTDALFPLAIARMWCATTRSPRTSYSLTLPLSRLNVLKYPTQIVERQAKETGSVSVGDATDSEPEIHGLPWARHFRDLREVGAKAIPGEVLENIEEDLSAAARIFRRVAAIARPVQHADLNEYLAAALLDRVGIRYQLEQPDLAVADCDAIIALLTRDDRETDLSPTETTSGDGDATLSNRQRFLEAARDLRAKILKEKRKKASEGDNSD